MRPAKAPPKKALAGEHVRALQTYGRMLICAEQTARGNGSILPMALPTLKRERVVAYHLGLVAGKTQTNYPWYTW